MCLKSFNLLRRHLVERSRNSLLHSNFRITSSHLLSTSHHKLFKHNTLPKRVSESRLYGSIAPANLTLEEMDQCITDLVRQIHDTPAKAVFYVAGGGAQVGSIPPQTCLPTALCWPVDVFDLCSMNIIRDYRELRIARRSGLEGVALVQENVG